MWRAGALCLIFSRTQTPGGFAATLNNHNMASLVNGSFASPLADANMRIVMEGGWLAKVYNGMSGLNVLISFLLVLVAYDQCKLHDANGCGLGLLMWE